jgi:hypothetical protein
MGHSVLEVMGLGAGFATEVPDRRRRVVFGEIGAVGGARLADAMNYASDVDVYRGWAEGSTAGSARRSTASTTPPGLQAGAGQGRIQHIEACPGCWPRSASTSSTSTCSHSGRRGGTDQHDDSDGVVALRHPDLDTTIEMADRVATELQLYAG